MNKLEHLLENEANIAEVLLAARKVQDFLWGATDPSYGIEEWLRSLRKRIIKMEQIDFTNPHWKTEMRKRLLQTAAISVACMTKLEMGELDLLGTGEAPSHLSQYSETLEE